MVMVGADNRLAGGGGADCPSVPILSHPSAARPGAGKFPELGVVMTPARPEGASFSLRNLDFKAPRGVNGRLRVCQCCVCPCESARARVCVCVGVIPPVVSS